MKKPERTPDYIYNKYGVSWKFWFKEKIQQYHNHGCEEIQIFNNRIQIYPYLPYKDMNLLKVYKEWEFNIEMKKLLENK